MSTTRRQHLVTLAAAAAALAAGSAQAQSDTVKIGVIAVPSSVMPVIVPMDRCGINTTNRRFAPSCVSKETLGLVMLNWYSRCTCMRAWATVQCNSAVESSPPLVATATRGRVTVSGPCCR